jgi:hypothetical protein
LVVIVGCPICLSWLIKNKKKQQEVASSNTADQIGEKQKDKTEEDNKRAANPIN